MLYPLILEQVSDGYVVAVPDIDGCYSAGNTMEDAYQNVKQAIEFHLESIIKDGAEVPLPTSIENHKNAPDLDGHNLFFGIVDVDLSHLMNESKKSHLAKLSD